MLSFRDYMSVGGWWFNSVVWVTVPLLSLLANNKTFSDCLAEDDSFFPPQAHHVESANKQPTSV